MLYLVLKLKTSQTRGYILMVLSILAIKMK